MQRRLSGTGSGRRRQLLLALFGLYFALIVAWLVLTRSFPEPDVVAICLLAFAFMIAQTRRFLRDWSIFVLLLLGYVLLTGFVPQLDSRAHIQFPIDVDRWLFRGTVPTVWLQAHLWHPAGARWYDYASLLLYLQHFAAPLAFAFLLWLRDSNLYRRFAVSLLVLCYAGFFTYLVFPMAPPWWAGDIGRLPGAQLLTLHIAFPALGDPITLATSYFRTNPVAAMPSLHAAFPFLIWLVFWRLFPRWGWLAVPYPLAVAFAVVYLGDHYVVDVLAGWLYATTFFALTWRHLPAPSMLPAAQPDPPVLSPTPAASAAEAE